MSSRAAKPFPADIAELIRKTAEATPFTALAGIRVEAIEHGMVTVRLPFREAISRSFGIVHGGALMTLMDVAGGLASATAQETWEPGQTNVTIASSAQFLSVASGVDLIAVGRCTKAGKSIKFCEVEVTANGEPVARGAFTFKTTQMRRPLRPASRRAAGAERVSRGRPDARHRRRRGSRTASRASCSESARGTRRPAGSRSRRS